MFNSIRGITLSYKRKMTIIGVLMIAIPLIILMLLYGVSILIILEIVGVLFLFAIALAGLALILRVNDP